MHNTTIVYRPAIYIVIIDITILGTFIYIIYKAVAVQVKQLPTLVV